MSILPDDYWSGNLPKDMMNYWQSVARDFERITCGNCPARVIDRCSFLDKFVDMNHNGTAYVQPKDFINHIYNPANKLCEEHHWEVNLMLEVI